MAKVYTITTSTTPVDNGQGGTTWATEHNEFHNIPGVTLQVICSDHVFYAALNSETGELIDWSYHAGELIRRLSK